METSASRSIQRRMIKSFLDILILAQLRKRPMSGYDVINFVYSEFHFFISSGTIYSLLHSLERDGLIDGVWGRRKRLYNLTKKGEETFNAFAGTNYRMQCLMSSLLKLLANTENSKTSHRAKDYALVAASESFGAS